MYEPEYMGYKYSIFISKFQKKQEQTKEQSFLKKRRELVNEGTAYTDIKIRKGILYLKNRPVDFSNRLNDSKFEISAMFYNIRSLFKLSRRQKFSKILNSIPFDFVCRDLTNK